MKYVYKSNNLDFLRLVLATAVVFLHLAFLAKTPLTESVSESLHWLSGSAVSTFFIVSGFLIYMSYDRKKTIINYFWGRLLRLYPAYILLILFSSCLYFIVGDGSSVGSYTSEIKYFVANGIFLNFLAPTIDGVFSTHPEPFINGSLWTLKIEVMFYCMVPIFYMLLERKYSYLYMLAIYVLSFIYKDFILFHKDTIPMAETLASQLPGQMMYFIAGIFCFKYFDILKRQFSALLIASVILMWLNLYYLQPFVIAVFITLVFISLPNVLSFKKLGDISYGVYIFHFPIIQLFIANGFEFNTVSSYFVLFTTIFVVSTASWKLVEAPSLRLKNRFF